MKARTKELLDKIDENHDWRRGQVYGGSGDSYNSRDECRVCGLQRHWDSGSRQNDIPSSTTFTTATGDSVTLRDAANLDC